MYDQNCKTSIHLFLLYTKRQTKLAAAPTHAPNKQEFVAWFHTFWLIPNFCATFGNNKRKKEWPWITWCDILSSMHRILAWPLVPDLWHKKFKQDIKKNLQLYTNCIVVDYSKKTWAVAEFSMYIYFWLLDLNTNLSDLQISTILKSAWNSCRNENSLFDLLFVSKMGEPSS